MLFNFYKRIMTVLVGGGSLVGALLILIVTFTTFYEVIARYFFHSPTTWSLDFGIYFVMWGTFLGAAFTMRTHGHIGVEVLVQKLSRSIQRQIKIGVYSLCLAFCVILTWTALKSCIEAYRFNEVTLSYSRTPLYVPMASIVIGSGLMVLEIIRQLIDFIRPGDEK
jgi:TRAP-type C4-dicarboxylate transport system permease small subunit